MHLFPDIATVPPLCRQTEESISSSTLVLQYAFVRTDLSPDQGPFSSMFQTLASGNISEVDI